MIQEGSEYPQEDISDIYQNVYIFIYPQIIINKYVIQEQFSIFTLYIYISSEIIIYISPLRLLYTHK